VRASRDSSTTRLPTGRSGPGQRGRRHVGGGVDRAEQLLALSGRTDLTGRVPGGKPSPQPRSSPVGELLCSREQQLADAVERIWPATPMSEGGLLCFASGLEEAGLVQAERGDTFHSGGVVHQRPAVVTYRPHHGRPADPEVAGDRCDCVGVLADLSAGLGAGRSVSTVRGPMAATRSVQVRTPQAGSRQRQIRLCQHSTTGRPPTGRSRTLTVRRPWGAAGTPQPGQPTTLAVVWTVSCHSPPASSAARTSMPSKPGSADPDPLL
jgi:hypothetical protein